MRIAAFLLILVGFTTAPAQNLIVNPGAELPPVGNGWTQVSGFWTNGTEVGARSGLFHFYAGDNSLGGSELYQDINVSSFATSIDMGLSTFTFNTYMRVYNFSGGIWNDRGRAIVEYRNGFGTVLNSYDTGLQNSLVWTLYNDTRTAPVGTRTIRIRLIASRNTGTAADGYFDDLSLTHSSTLPVTLLSWQGKNIDSHIVLDWKTSEEISNDYFTIERSTNSIDWNTIATIDGAGTTQQLTGYSFTDTNPAVGIQYYRLIQSDINGTTSISNVIAVPFYSSTGITLFPNPTADLIHLSVAEASNTSVILYSIAGEKVLSLELNPGNFHTLNLQSLSPGIYLLEYTTDEKVSRFTLRKE
jgi:hypothetical protein